MKKITRNVNDFEIYKQEVTRPETLGIGGWELGGVDTGKQKKYRLDQTLGSYCWHFHQEFKRLLKKYMQVVTKPEALEIGGWVLGVVDSGKQNNVD